MMLIGKRIGIVLLLLLFASRPVAAVEFEFSGFGDVSYGWQIGDPADEEAAEEFEEFGDEEVNLHRRFSLFGTDFVVLAHLTDRLTYLAEVQIETEPLGTEVDIERMYLDYQVTNWLNLQLGEFFTPIGYWNRTLYGRAWLMTSVQRPELFEEEFGGFTPTHSIGVQAYGNIPTWGGHSMNYAVSLTNGRTEDPITKFFQRNPYNKTAVTGLLEWVVPNYRDFRIGISGWTDKIYSAKVDTVGDTASLDDPTTEGMVLRETGFDPYLVLYSKHFNLIFEYVHILHKDLKGNLDEEETTLNGYTAELALNLMGGKLHPYVRYDVIRLPEEGGPYLPLRRSEIDDDLLMRTFVPDIERVLVGVAYDLYAYNRIKVEYGRNLEGFRDENQLILQSAFAF